MVTNSQILELQQTMVLTLSTNKKTMLERKVGKTISKKVTNQKLEKIAETLIEVSTKIDLVKMKK